LFGERCSSLRIEASGPMPKVIMTKLYIAQHGQDLRALAESEDGLFHDITDCAGGIYSLSQGGLIPLIRQGKVGVSRVKRQIADDPRPLGAEFLKEADILPPVVWPSKIVCVGQNYADHCAEQNIEPPKKPLLFTKFPQCIIGPGASIHYPDF